MPVNFDVYHFLQHLTKQSYITYDQKILPQNGEWILTKEGIGNHVYLIHLHCRYQKHQKLLQHVKKKIMSPLTHLSLKIFPNGTAFDVIFINFPIFTRNDHLSFKISPNGTAFEVIFIHSPILNRNLVNGVLNMTLWKYSITTTYTMKGGIVTTDLPQRIIGQWECIPGFIVNQIPPPYNINMMITRMHSFH